MEDLTLSYEQVLPMAKKIAGRFSFLSHLTFEDRVQECLLKWVEIERKGMYVTRNLVYLAMKNRMIDIARTNGKVIWESLEAEPEDKSEPKEFFVVAIPKEWGPTRKFVRILLEKDLNVRDAADEMGISYDRAYNWWRKVKAKAREMMETKSYSLDDVLLVIEASV